MGEESCYIYRHWEKVLFVGVIRLVLVTERTLDNKLCGETVFISMDS